MKLHYSQPIIIIGIKFIGVNMAQEDNVVRLINLTEQKAREILNEIAQDSSRIEFSKHARQRMSERNITLVQIIRILGRGKFEEQPHRTPNGNWQMKLSGLSAGHDIKIVCALDYKAETGNYAIIITTYIV